MRRELAMDDVEISIPAPARGRTTAREKRAGREPFQFPPPRGGERWPVFVTPAVTYFNSRPREGANVATERWKIEGMI